MKKKTGYETHPFGKQAVIGERVELEHFPSPKAIADSLKTTKVTLALGSQAVNVIKTQAKKHQVPYQVMIRHLVDSYAARLSE